MAGVIFTAQNEEYVLTTANTESILQVVAPANQRVKVVGWGVFFDGTSVTQEPVSVRITGSASGSQGTWTYALTAPNANGSKTVTNGASETVQSIASTPATVEPTVATIFDSCEIHPQSGYEVRLPLGQEFIVEGGKSVQIELTTASGVTPGVKCKLICEE
jgi:hypothetical protein